jgi:hypothetical protein
MTTRTSIIIKLIFDKHKKLYLFWLTFRYIFVT